MYWEKKKAKCCVSLAESNFKVSLAGKLPDFSTLLIMQSESKDAILISKEIFEIV
jgi:hypothetical protein